MFHGLLLFLSVISSWNTAVLTKKTRPIRDTSAEFILEKASQTLQSYQTLQINFNLNLETYSSNQIKIQAHKPGVFKMKGHKYYAGIREQEFFFDGNILRVYDKRSNELQISKPDPNRATGMGLSPQQIFTDVNFYKQGFKYRLIGKVLLGSRNCWKIELVPVDRTVIFTKIWLYISEQDFRIRKAVIADKRGSKYTYSIKRTAVNKPLDDNVFTFDENEHKNVEIIDLR